MMHMTFYWSRNVTLLFSSWQTDSWISYALTLLACFIFSIFYQYMEDRRLRFKLLSTSAASTTTNGTAVDATPLLNKKIIAGSSRWSVGRVAGAVLFGINSAIGYFLMLAVMSFNGGVFVAIVVGLAVGYLLFRSGDDEQVVIVDNPCACA
ncbi:putative Ctr copper transporter [Helianthus annuus]|nr:putative Ctr copper transporter [Helianthus annuus]